MELYLGPRRNDSEIKIQHLEGRNAARGDLRQVTLSLCTQAGEPMGVLVLHEKEVRLITQATNRRL